MPNDTPMGTARRLERKVGILPDKPNKMDFFSRVFSMDLVSVCRFLAENSKEVITVRTADDILLYVSPSVKATLGYRPEDALGCSISDLLSDKDCETFSAAPCNALKQGDTSFFLEHRLRRKDGREIWVETRGILFLSPEKEIRAIYCSSRNIDERKRTEDKLSTMTRAIENMCVPVYWVQWDGKIIYANQAACDFIGYSRDELTRMTVSDIDSSFSMLKKDPQWESFRGLGHSGFETRHRTKDGRMLHVEVMSDCTQIAGQDIYWVFARDIGRRKHAEEAMFQMEQRLRQSEKMEAIGLLAGGIAHDFNNQLAGLLGYADLLRDEVTDSTQLEYADAIILGIKRAAELTGQLLAFSRRGKYLSIPVNMNVIVREVDSILRHSIDKKITIHNRLCDGEALITGDPSLLQNAVLNLAINARDAMPAGGTLTFYTQRLFLDDEFCKKQSYAIKPGDYIEVSVADTGIGMDDEVREHAFEPFFTTKEQGKGTGMGLSAVYGTVKNHKGLVNIYSELGRGTAVKLYLPAAAHNEVAPKDTADFPAHRKFSLNVLLVEDEIILGEAATAMLRRLGCRVSVCGNGREAADLYEQSWREIDLVILDMVMPVMDGKETFEAMRRINPNAAIVIASGYSLEGEAQALIDKGALGFVQKPYRKNDLARAIIKAAPPEAQTRGL